MNRVKDTFNRFWTRARGFGRRRRRDGSDGGEGGEGGENEKRTKSPGNGAWRLIPLAGALSVSGAVFAILMRCEYGAYVLPMFRASWCGASTQAFGFLSTSAGVGFLIFLTAEVVVVILAQIWKDRQIDRAERREEAAERRAEAAERMVETAARQAETAARQAEAAERRAEQAELARREDAERAERRAEQAEQARREDTERAERRAEQAEQARREDTERAERRELRLIELIESLKNGKAAGAE